MSVAVEVRCPNGPRRLFSKLKLAGEKPTYTDDNLIEFACGDCRREMHDQSVTRVLHRYNFIGDLIETAVERSDSEVASVLDRSE